MTHAIERDGFAVLPQGVATNRLCEVEAALGNLTGADAANAPGLRRSGEVFALRNLLEIEVVRQLASGELRQFVAPILGTNCFPVRGILFDKNSGANWKVPFHQDLSIAVRDKIEVEGFGPWSQKAGVWHVQPPAGILAEMLTLRLHLDACGAQNGPLRVLPGSHQSGKFGSAEIQQWRQKRDESVCALPRGGVLLMRPLLLHASSPAQNPGRRRVVHLEYAACELPGGLQWHAVIAP